MSDMDMSRRGLLKTSLFGAAAAGMTGIAAAAEAKSSKKAPVMTRSSWARVLQA